MSPKRSRPRTVTTLAPETVDELSRISRESGESRGRVIDAALTHAPACKCPVCDVLHEIEIVACWKLGCYLAVDPKHGRCAVHGAQVPKVAWTPKLKGKHA